MERVLDSKTQLLFKIPSLFNPYLLIYLTDIFILFEEIKPGPHGHVNEGQMRWYLVNIFQSW